jgi:hypothetical protein
MVGGPFLICAGKIKSRDSIAARVEELELSLLPW